MIKNNMGKLRSERNMDFKELSFKSGISERYLRFIEKSEKTPSLETASRIAKALNTSVDDLFLF